MNALTNISAPSADIMEKVFAEGRLDDLSPEQRMQYYSAVCQSVGLNPMPRPFEFVRLSGKLVLYARRDCADQLRKIHGITIEVVEKTAADGLFMVHVRARDAKGRSDEDFGAVPFGNLQGEARANAILKAITKAKRRVTLSICGLGMLDETEVESVQAGAREVPNYDRAPQPSRPAQSGGLLEHVQQQHTQGLPLIDSQGTTRAVSPGKWLEKAAEVLGKLDSYERVEQWSTAMRAHQAAVPEEMWEQMTAAVVDRADALAAVESTHPQETGDGE